LRLQLTYRRIKAADQRCKEIVQELRELPPIEYCPQETRGLNQEFIWSCTFIINQCDMILESDEYGKQRDFRAKMTRFKERYEDTLRSIDY
jgi:hypothetical protein